MAILTGSEIQRQHTKTNISVDPFDPENLGPNSLDLRIHQDLLVYEDPILDMNGSNSTTKLTIPKEGLILQPGILYLGRTIEKVGSKAFVPIVEGRSSVGRLGMQVHSTAGFCDLGFYGTITLEITVTQPLRVYSDLRVCQVYFIQPYGDIKLYQGRYQGQSDPTPSRMHHSLGLPYGR